MMIRNNGSEGVIKVKNKAGGGKKLRKSQDH